MFDSINTTATIFVDGFGGVAVEDFSKLDQRVIDYMKCESVHEVFCDMANKERGRYEVKLQVWHESNFPDPGGEFCSDIISFEKLN